MTPAVFFLAVALLLCAFAWAWCACAGDADESREDALSRWNRLKLERDDDGTTEYAEKFPEVTRHTAPNVKPGILEFSYAPRAPRIWE